MHVGAAGLRARSLARRAVAAVAALAVLAFAPAPTPGGLGVPAALAFAPAAIAADAPDNPSDIPGIPLPGPITTGILGGPVFDVVYRIDLAPGTILVAGLSGSPGTDFDLYLFDSSATTVFTTVGLVARSTGPTSDESISYGTMTGGRFYLNLHGFGELQGAYTLTVQTAVDRTPPIASILLEGGRPATNRDTVGVTLTATDDLSAVVDMAFSLDGVAFGPWQPFAPTASVILFPGDGPKSVWARVRNSVGLVSAAAVGTITVDTRPPQVVSVSPAPDSRVGSLRPVLRVTFDEPIDAASWGPNGLIVQRADGTRVTGLAAVEASGLAATFVPDADLPAGSAIVVTVGPVTDVAGNALLAIPSWTIVPLEPASLVAVASARVVSRGGEVVVRGTYRGVSPAPALTVLVRPGTPGGVAAGAGGVAAGTGGVAAGSGGVAAGFEPAITVPVAPDGTFEFTVRPALSTAYRVEAPGTATVAGAAAEFAIAVRRDLRLLANGVSSGTSRAGRRVVVGAVAGPPAPGLSVTLRLYRWSPAARTWQLISTRPRTTDAAGSVATGWSPTTPGRYRWRATVGRTADFSTAFSSWVSWTVTR